MSLPEKPQPPEVMSVEWILLANRLIYAIGGAFDAMNPFGELNELPLLIGRVVGRRVNVTFKDGGISRVTPYNAGAIIPQIIKSLFVHNDYAWEAYGGHRFVVRAWPLLKGHRWPGKDDLCFEASSSREWVAAASALEKFLRTHSMQYPKNSDEIKELIATIEELNDDLDVS